MEFHIATGFGLLKQSFSNIEDPTQTAQWVLQSSSSAAPIYNVNFDVSLKTYNQPSKGAIFKHPITGNIITDHATSYVNDKGEMLNSNDADIDTQNSKTMQCDQLFQAVNHNTDLYTKLLWISGVNLNES